MRKLLTAMTPGSVTIDRLVLWHIPCIHYNRLAINSSSSGIGLTLALVTAATRATPAVLKSAAGVTIIGNGRVCHMLVNITRLRVKNPRRSTGREDRTPVRSGVFTYKAGSHGQCGEEG